MLRNSEPSDYPKECDLTMGSFCPADRIQDTVDMRYYPDSGKRIGLIDRMLKKYTIASEYRLTFPDITWTHSPWTGKARREDFIKRDKRAIYMYVEQE